MNEEVLAVDDRAIFGCFVDGVGVVWMYMWTGRLLAVQWYCPDINSCTRIKMRRREKKDEKTI